MERLIHPRKSCLSEATSWNRDEAVSGWQNAKTNHHGSLGRGIVSRGKLAGGARLGVIWEQFGGIGG